LGPSSSGSGLACSSRLDRVGRDGTLRLAFERRGGGTVLRERRFALPLQALEPIALDGHGSLCLLLLNPTGGVLGGDRLATEIVLGPGAHALFTTPSATRVYRALGPPSLQDTTIRLGAGAWVEYLPDHLIPHPGSAFHQSLTVEMGPGSRAIVADAWAVGRVARGERWQFRELVSRTAITAGGRPLFLDRVRLEPARGIPRGLGGLEEFDYLATLVVVGEGLPGWEDPARALDDCLGRWSGVRGGASPIGRHGCLVRLLALTAQDLVEATRGLWTLSRGLLLGLPPLDLRK
jgi:urease accessory protein